MPLFRTPSTRGLVVMLAAFGLLPLYLLNNLYRYPPGLDEAPALRSADIVNPLMAGKPLRLRGEVLNSFTTPHGMVVVTLYDAVEDLNIGAPIFPSFGKLRRRLQRGQQVEIIGSVGFYRGRPQLNPLSTEHVRIQFDWTSALPVAEAKLLAGKIVQAGPLRITEWEKFRSAAGKHHIRLTLADDSATVAGILFEGDWNEEDVAMLKAGGQLFVNARVGEFRDLPSLVVNKMTPAAPRPAP